MYPSGKAAGGGGDERIPMRDVGTPSQARHKQLSVIIGEHSSGSSERVSPSSASSTPGASPSSPTGTSRKGVSSRRTSIAQTLGLVEAPVELDGTEFQLPPTAEDVAGQPPSPNALGTPNMRMVPRMSGTPRRMFGKGLNARKSIKVEKVLDIDDENTPMSSKEPTTKEKEKKTFRLDVARLPLPKPVSPDAPPLPEVKLDINFSLLTQPKHLCDGSNSNLFTAKMGQADVIVKRLKVEKMAYPQVFNEFEFESEFLRRSVNHPNIVRIIAAGADPVAQAPSLALMSPPDKMHNAGKIDLDIEASANSPVSNGSSKTTAKESFSTGNSGMPPEASSAPPVARRRESAIARAKEELMVPFVVLERLDGGSLAFFLNKKRSFHSRPFTHLRLYTILTELADALHYIHEGFNETCHIIHRDLKPDNIAFTSEEKLKLLDFGLSICVARRTEATTSYQMTGGTGSLRYMAPEVIMNQPYNEKADIYSFGLIAYEALTGVSPYGNMKKEKFITTVVNKRERPPLGLDDYGRTIKCPDELKTMIAQCWDHDPLNRPSAGHCLQVLTQLLEEERVRASKAGPCMCS